MSEFRGILKATALFGSVQFYSVLMQLVKTKYIAVLLGPSGVGSIGLITSTITLIASFTELGIKNASVREVARAENKKELIRTSKFIAFITGFTGSVITLIGSSQLSEYLFDSNDWTGVFMSLSVVVFLMHNSNVNLAIIQALQRRKMFARINVIAGLLTTFTSLFFYYFFGLKGVVGALLSTSIITYLFSLYYTYDERIFVKDIPVLLRSAKPLVVLGLSISIAGIAYNVSNYSIRLLVSKIFSEEQLGFYTSASSLINSYLGLILAAMAMDFFPRISQVSIGKELNGIIRYQIIIALSIVVPLLIGLISFMEEAISLLYSSSFLPMLYMSRLFAVGAVLRIVGWALGYVLLTKGSGKIFIVNEISGGLYQVGLAVLFTYLYDFDGLGYALIASNLLYALQTFLILRMNLSVKLGKHILLVVILLFCFLLIWNYLITWSLVPFKIQIIVIIIASMSCVYFLYKKSR